LNGEATFLIGQLEHGRGQNLCRDHQKLLKTEKPIKKHATRTASRLLPTITEQNPCTSHGRSWSDPVADLCFTIIIAEQLMNPRTP
jgi:hypothetical protein